MRKEKEERIANSTNSVIEILNSNQLEKEEILVTLAQVLIYTGKSMARNEVDLEKINWEEIERTFFMDVDKEKGSDVGLGLILNGGAIMEYVSETNLNDPLSDEIATQEKE